MDKPVVMCDTETQNEYIWDISIFKGDLWKIYEYILTSFFIVFLQASTTGVICKVFSKLSLTYVKSQFIVLTYTYLTILMYTESFLTSHTEALATM